jgi:hypothetical protein
MNLYKYNPNVVGAMAGLFISGLLLSLIFILGGGSRFIVLVGALLMSVVGVSGAIYFRKVK